MKKAYSLFLSPRGRIGRKMFVIAFLLWCFFYTGQYIWFEQTGESLLNFFLSLVLLVLNIHIIFCIYGKRLHDIGRSTWALIGMFVVVLIISIFVMLNFGGLEYFDTIMQNPDKQNDQEFMREVHQRYQNTLAANLPKIGPLMLVVPLLFTAWLAVKLGDEGENRYGACVSVKNING